MGIASGAFIGPSPTRASTAVGPVHSKGMLGELQDGSVVAFAVVAIAIALGVIAVRRRASRRRGSG
jgi:hypothetical protein